MGVVKGSWVFAAMIGVAVGGGIGAGIGIHHAMTADSPSPQSTASAAEWPSNVAGILPEPDFSQCPVASHETLASAEIWYAGVSHSEALAYARDLRDTGYAIDPREGDFGNMYCYAASDAEKEGHAVVVDYDCDMDFLKVKVSWDYATSDEEPNSGKDVDKS